MNVLILGEFSAFAKNLAKGIEHCGSHKVVVICDGDGFKSIKQSNNSIVYPRPHNLSFGGIKIPKSSYISGFVNFLKSRKTMKQFKSFFDVVFIMNCRFIRDNYEFTSPYYSIKDIRTVSRKGAKVFMSACGGDFAFFSFAISDRRFATVYNQIPNQEYFYNKERLASIIVDGVIPMSYQYAEAYRKFGTDFNLLPALQLPFDVNSVPVKDFNGTIDKVVIFNGGLRPTKGTKYIEQALKYLKSKYADSIIVKDERFPYDVFITKLKEYDLYIDLCTDYDYGMSAIAAMSAGCVVFSGNENETKKEFGIEDDIPVVPLSPDVDDIVSKLSYYIDNKDEIKIIGKKSREYVEKYHECSKVAYKYLEFFSQ